MKKTLLLCLFAALSFAPPSRAEAPPVFDRVQRADGARIAPDRFLRAYDPLTIFFPGDVGPKAGGPEDAPAKYATITPQPAGDWRWIGPRALQFRPAEPWKPLERVSVKSATDERRLVTLLPTPSSTNPAADADPAQDLTQIALTFAQPVDAAALARLVTVELRPAPGVSAQGGQILSPSAYDIRPLERGARGDEQTYVLRLRDSIADGRVVILRLKLSDEPGLDDETYELRIRTALPFAVTEASCGRGWDDTHQGGVLRCAANGFSPAPESGAEEGGDAASTYAATNKRRLSLAFNARPETLDILRAREALRITPPVDDMAVENDGDRLRIAGKFLSDTVYEVRIAPGSIKDDRGRPLAETFSQRFAFTRDIPALQWDAGYGLVERYGAQLLPLRGRGYDRADIRIHAIDPLARDFWPFPQQGVETSDGEAPPLPGNEPARWSESGNIEAEAIKARIKLLGSPAVSRLVDLPIKRNGADAKFGVDLKEDFARVSGRDQPGTYLVGLRPVDQEKRKWLRVQVTDLSLSAIEEPTRVRFAVTSLATAQPVGGAQIRVEGVKDDKFVTLATGTTDESGFFSWSPIKRGDGELRRVVVSKGLDTLVIDPDSAPSEYARELWSKPEAPWLSWVSESDTPREEKARTLCHVFSERPIYRPEEPAHIKGFVRSYRGGALSLTKTGGALVVTGPNNQEWRIPVKLDAAGGFYHKFDAQTPATGDYSVKFEPDAPKAKKAEKTDGAEPSEGEGAEAAQDTSCGQFTFKKEAYRLPTFEVVLNAPQTVALDGTFDVDLLARYFAGGLAADRPVKWRAAQFPHVFTPPNREGFLFSTDARFSGDGKFKSTAVLERDQRTDAGGAARMTFDATVEPTAQPRRYSIEATVTGDDGIEVRNVQNVIALPPFVLGVKTPRYVERPGAVTPEIIAVDGKGETIAGLDMTLRLIKRNWISTLQASDFAQGAAKYVTQTQDETIFEQKITSAREAQKIALEAKSAGVYLVQLEAYDRLKRRQQVSVDFFVGGDTPVTFARPPAASATITTDKEKYAPGETATLVIQSPFQKARALAIVEQPNGVYEYSFVDIANGFGRFPLTVKKEQLPKLAVHFLIMRGRLENSAPQPSANFDQGKPVTIAATKWIEVTPVKNIVNVKLEHPAKARPGQEVEVTLRLADDMGKPLAGDATFWLVDQAVLSLAKERPLDPLPDFIVARETKMAARDTRNMAFGVIPLEEIAGGDGELQEWGAENNISVRKNFTPVPIYLPSVKVGADGVAKIKFTLPDTLTVFKLRAKAVSGPDRFGAAGGEMLIRQELVAQPALPRFIRPGDAFDIGLVARIVEGPGGAGKASIAAPALKLAGEAARKIDWAQNRPVRVDRRAEAPTALEESAKLGFRIERDADHARDAVEIDLPVKPDRAPVTHYEIVEIAPGDTKTLAAVGAPMRAKTFSRDVVVAADPAIVKLVAGLTMLVDYPYGCTEQRLALSRAALALKGFSPILSAAGLQDRVSSSVRSTAQQIEQSIDGDGLVAFWPRARGNVLLTAWAYAFLAQAERAGEPIDATLRDRLANILRLSLRSDYPRLLGGEEMRERAAALAALAEGGKLDESYVAEFSRRADFLPNESVAELAAAAARLPDIDQRILASLMETMWGRVKFANRNGKQVYAGQAGESASELILPSETRNLAEMLRAAARAAPADPRAPVLRDALLRLGDGDGWGTTNGNASAIEALAEGWRRPLTPIGVAFVQGGAPITATIDANNPVARHVVETDAPLTLSNTSNTPLVALVETRYMPAEPGASAEAISAGFVVTRQSWRVKSGATPEKLDAASGAIHVTQGDVIEETAEVVNPEDRTYVAISVPLAAGYEPLNPNIATAPAEAQPSSAPTLAPTWVSYGDDRVLFAYDSLPKGNYRFAFRLKAQTAGAYTQPPATVETMYKKGLLGASAGARVDIAKAP